MSTKEVILLGTHFMFTEELGSRLRGEGYTVYPFDDEEHLDARLSNDTYKVVLVIVDLQHEPAGGIETIHKVKDEGIVVLAIGEHKKTDALQKARDAGSDKVIINSQASDSIEKYVNQLLNN